VVAGVEEQFYVAWPVLLVGLLAVMRGRRIPVLLVVLAGIGGSATLMAHLYSPWEDSSRLYYGTDTRAAPLLVGAALALWHGRRRAGDRGSQKAARLRASYPLPELQPVGLTGLLGLGVLGAAVVTARDTTAFLYRGGFLVVAVATAAVIASVVSSGRLVEFLQARPLVWLGTRSYAVYLWHWPVFDLVRPGSEVHAPAVVVRVVECCVILILAELSFRLIEDPIRHGGIGRLADRARHGRRVSRVVAALGLVFAIGGAGTAAAASAVRLEEAGRTHHATSAAVDQSHPDVSLGLGTAPPVSSTPGPAATPTTGSGTAAGHPFATPVHVSVFGDSQGMTLVLNKPPDTGHFLTLDDQTVEGCGILLGRVVSRSGERRDLGAACASWPGEWAAKAKAEQPQIALVMLGAWDVFDLHLADRTLVFGTPEWDAEYLARLDQGVKILRGSGARVALAMLPVYRPVGKPGTGAGFWPERGDDSRTAHLNALLQSYAAKSAPAGTAPTVFLIKPPAEFSAGNPIASNTAYRWDGVHFYKQGAQLYLKTVIPQLLAIPSS